MVGERMGKSHCLCMKSYFSHFSISSKYQKNHSKGLWSITEKVLAWGKEKNMLVPRCWGPCAGDQSSIWPTKSGAITWGSLGKRYVLKLWHALLSSLYMHTGTHRHFPSLEQLGNVQGPGRVPCSHKANPRKVGWRRGGFFLPSCTLKISCTRDFSLCAKYITLFSTQNILPSARLLSLD